jgi:hypothetical protein
LPYLRHLVWTEKGRKVIWGSVTKDLQPYHTTNVTNGSRKRDVWGNPGRFVKVIR